MWCATAGPDPSVRAAADAPRPGITPSAWRPDEEVGKPPTATATPGTVDLALPDAADSDQDEWGFFDPGHCGYAALAATLDTVPEEVQQNAEPSPADMLLAFETGADRAARPQPLTIPEPPTRQEAPTGPTAARQEPKREQPAPLALWAHLFGWETEPSTPRTRLRYTEAMAEVAALLVGLSIPAQIAEVAYGSGCRVHRVRGLACPGPTAPAMFDVASSRPDSSSVFLQTIPESSPAA